MATEVFNNIGEAEMHEIHSENPNFFRRQKDESDSDRFEISDKIESISKPISNSKKEFFKHLEDKDDSLTVDTCNKLNHDWKKK